MTTRDIRVHPREMYGVQVSPDLISRVADAVVDELAEWQSRPLDARVPVNRRTMMTLARASMTESRSKHRPPLVRTI
jgi:Transposase, Mutator family